MHANMHEINLTTALSEYVLGREEGVKKRIRFAQL